MFLKIYQKLVWLQTWQPHGEAAYSQSCHTWYTHPHAGIGSIGLFCQILFLQLWLPHWKKEAIHNTVKLGNKERFDKEQIGIKELFMDYQPFYTINLLLDKELLPI